MAIEISNQHLNTMVNYLTWKNKAHLHFLRFLDSVLPMPLSDRFCNLLDQFRALTKLRADRKQGQAIPDAASEFLRRAVNTRGPLEGDEYLMEDALQWLQGYKALTRRLGKALGGLYEFHGDSFGDLIDSMPLAGRGLCERALKTAPRCRDGFLTEDEVTDAIKALPEPWDKLVGDELYVVLNLENNAEEYLPCWMKHNVMTPEHGAQIKCCRLD